MKKILIIGPFTKQINGMTVANKMLLDGLNSIYHVEFIDTLKDVEFDNKENQGKFRLLKLIKILKYMFKEIYTLSTNQYNYIYITPGQSFYGFARFIPYMLVAIFKKSFVYLHIHGSKFREMYDIQSKLKQFLIKFFLKRAKGIIVLGDSLRFMVDELVPKDKIFICENGVEDRFVASLKDIEAKIKGATNKKKQNVLFLSNLMQDKGVLTLLKASESFSEKEIVINLAGKIEPKIEVEIMEYLNKYPGKIIYNGVVDGITKKELLLKSDIFILPSKDEGQPISILEAYANACSVITDKSVGGIRDIFSDGINGYSCDHKDYFSIIDGIKNQTLNKEAMMKNYNYFNQSFTEDEFVRRVFNILEGN
ncbi:glycosyltransferase family 4 protein [Salipaludibacillus sp. CF4.18]|uniref:glycosyltransferase family 4 protein n=1 Tax=Salipaludibacillus sp. CF4.18 TaxID=3373081 RepID=UPI003EE5E453